MGINTELEIAKQAAEIYLDDTTGKLNIKEAVGQVQKNLNKLDAIYHVIKYISDKDGD